MADKYLQTFAQMAGEFKDGGGDKGKLFQKALKVAEGMTDEKHKGAFQQAELVAAKVFGSEEEDETAAASAPTSSNDTTSEASKPKPPPKKKPPPGKPSYLIPKKDNTETNETDEDEQQLEETVEEEAPTPPNPKPKKRPPAGIPSYLIKKEEPEEEATEEETPTEKEQKQSLVISTNEPDLLEEEGVAETVTPSPKPKKRPPAGIPSYLIKKEEESEPLVEAEAEAIAVNEDEVSETEVSETEGDETEGDETPPKPEPKKRPQAGIPSYLIKKEEPEETEEEERTRKKAELQAGIREEEAEIARLEQKARERAEARAKLEAELNEDSDDNDNDNDNDNDDESKKDTLKKGAAIAAGLAATAAVVGTTAVVVSERKKKKKVKKAKAELVQNHDLSQELSQMPPEDQPSPSAPPEDYDDNFKKKEQFYTVAVPVGVRGGQAFKVNVGGTVFEVTCPPNVGPGESIRVSLPKPGSRGRSKSPKSSPTATSPGALHYVVVPAGVSAGMPFRVRVGTSEFTVKCPPTAMAGQRIGVRVPTRSPIPSPPRSPVNTPPKKRYVIIPPNIYPGMHFVVDVNGQRFKVTCPPNSQPGERIAVTVPGAGGRSTTPPPPTGGGGSHVQYFDVIVPQGILPGSRFKIRANGKEFVVTCPANVGPGQKIRVPVSTSSANRNRPSSRSPIRTTYNTTSRPNSLSPVRTYNTANFQPYV